MSDLVGNPEDRFSHNEAQIIWTPRICCNHPRMTFSRVMLSQDADIMSSSADPADYPTLLEEQFDLNPLYAHYDGFLPENMVSLIVMILSFLKAMSGQIV